MIVVRDFISAIHKIFRSILAHRVDICVEAIVIPGEWESPADDRELGASATEWDG